jgi:hypothetical protein
MIAIEGGDFLNAHLKMLGGISDEEHGKQELRRLKEEAKSDSSGDSPRKLQLVVGVFKDKPKEMQLSVHARDAQDTWDKFDECSIIPLTVGGDAFCLKLLEEEHIVREQLHKRAKVTPSGGSGAGGGGAGGSGAGGGGAGGSGAGKSLVHMLFGSYHKDHVPIPYYGVYSSMEEAKKEVERREFDCFQIETVEMDDKAFCSKGVQEESF